VTAVEREIEVELPVRAVYNQWTMFEEFPRFMDGVEYVEQLSADRLHWIASIRGKREEWDAHIVEQVPDEKIAWRSESGSQNDGVVTFQPLADDRTKVRLRMEWEPEGAVERAGDALGFVERRVEADLVRFKEYLESVGHEAGGWRGEIGRHRIDGKDHGEATEADWRE
jgi:uncharacterized membrane protein